MVRSVALAALCTLITACTTPILDRGTYLADTRHHAQGVDSRVRFLVMHYTEIDEAGSLAVLTGDKVSVHYVVPERPQIRDGEPIVFQLVPEDKRAWHAGQSYWQGATELNASSIGIENVNLGPIGPLSDDKWQPYPPQQVDALIKLSRDIVARYNIPPTRVVGHSDIAPQRKIDPGPLFPWRTLYDAGVGAWPDDATVAAHLAGRDPKLPVDVQALQTKLRRYGYDVATDGVLDDKTRRVFSAFQMHFRPSDHAGNADAESDAIAQALLDKYFPN
ncbi:N-acetylmuramoyl-L-alanine amidase [Candidatus Burkholderia verschuerenii]|uniref:N-acetylmuramoyl-L-alanine amidase n=1 Tax=Candidatus Burkholderia verschuerenii TaxID=242163 RepID=A0A0L0MAQ6_9BURK|nr:N-acetylmuramoyl-L-alanine amidase [Candidatus Burkholderia verschuerenii]KND59366.1 N-acetylmuramoyl-L-alanine amidase [Candidatus Burkholderia verschuerenii]